MFRVFFYKYIHIHDMYLQYIQMVDRLLVTGVAELYSPSALTLADQRALSANRASWVSPISARFHAETRPTN